MKQSRDSNEYDGTSVGFLKYLNRESSTQVKSA